MQEYKDIQHYRGTRTQPPSCGLMQEYKDITVTSEPIDNMLWFDVGI